METHSIDKIQYDVALSFAGEDRDYAEKLAQILNLRNIKVFYDKFEKGELWGKDLYQHLDEVYSKKARFCVIFFSRYYGQKLWTKHELKSAQARAISENEEYILPYRIDDSELPGIRNTQGYLSKNDTTIEELAVILQKKLGLEIKEDSSSVSIPPIVSKKMMEQGVFIHDNGEAEIGIKMVEFFAKRLSESFPGVRGLKWFEKSSEILERFNILFRQPIVFNHFPGKEDWHGNVEPLWWFERGGSMPIDFYKVLNDDKILLGNYEFIIDKIAVYIDPADYRSFIYVLTKGENSVFTEKNDSVDYQLGLWSYAMEEYALYKNSIPITRAEFDDGSAVINDKVVKLKGEAELRIRSLTPFNFIICSKASVYNSNESDILFREHFDNLLKGQTKIEDVIPLLSKLRYTDRLKYEVDFQIWK